MKNVVLVAGAIFPPDDVRALSEMGIGPIFGPGTPMRELAVRIEEAIASRSTIA
jgi:methylmalonyl-CoA mutase cobalamin-binding domain/chain